MAAPNARPSVWMARKQDEDPKVGKLRERMQFDLGRRVAELRSARGLTQEAFAERVGWSVKYQQHVEGGQANVTIGTLALLATMFRVDARDLLAAPASRAVTKGRPRTRKQGQSPAVRRPRG